MEGMETVPGMYTNKSIHLSLEYLQTNSFNFTTVNNKVYFFISLVTFMIDFLKKVF